MDKEGLELLIKAKKELESFGMTIVSDYGEPLKSKNLCEWLIKEIEEYIAKNSKLL